MEGQRKGLTPAELERLACVLAGAPTHELCTEPVLNDGGTPRLDLEWKVP